MTPAHRRASLTLAIHPSTRGFGWTVFEGPFAPFDWGLVAPRKSKNGACLRKAERLIERLQPHTLVLEDFEPPRARRSGRVRRLCRALVALAADRGLEVAIYSRGEVRSSFASVGAVTRQEIAEAVVRHIPVFEHRMPRRRRCWESEDCRLSLFSAAALILTHYALNAAMLFHTLAE